ncbi:MAG: hypothetical protein HQL49_11990 [Gammaproteobacteria bacterium]|nr:hypothetical protein [Gammaproteobacteria bacterium]
MRRKSREVNLFSLSALDLFASALGAFMLIAIMALPYYLKTDQQLKAQYDALSEQNATLTAQLGDVERNLNQCQQQLEASAAENQRQQQQIAALQQQQNSGQALQQQLQQSQEALVRCEERRQQTFLIVMINWNTTPDIDLYMVPPAGEVFNFSKHNRTYRDYPNSRALLSVDSRPGPGFEVWQIPVASVGSYQVFYHYFEGSGAVEVTGSVYHRDGVSQLPVQMMRAANEGRAVTLIHVGADGSVTLRAPTR